jgi:protein-S-isoprenylcysteine O-methyltransferase Ste14
MALDRWIPVHPAGANTSVAWLARVVTLAGVAVTAAGLLTLLRARTGIMPLRPVRVLVTSGPYRFTRNPIYLGLTVAYLGLAVWLDQLWPLATLPLGLWVLKMTVIDVEESHLVTRFGEEYASYRRRVRRWI